MHFFGDKGGLNFEPVNLTMFERREPRVYNKAKDREQWGKLKGLVTRLKGPASCRNIMIISYSSYFQF
jgi:hypothetical protein